MVMLFLSLCSPTRPGIMKWHGRCEMNEGAFSTAEHLVHKLKDLTYVCYLYNLQESFNVTFDDNQCHVNTQ